jgi:hypothetical protein
VAVICDQRAYRRPNWLEAIWAFVSIFLTPEVFLFPQPYRRPLGMVPFPPFLNVFLQAGIGRGIHAAGFAGAQAVQANLAGQAGIHMLAVASGPLGWLALGASGCWTVFKLYQFSQSEGAGTTNTTPAESETSMAKQ